MMDQHARNPLTTVSQQEPLSYPIRFHYRKRPWNRSFPLVQKPKRSEWIVSIKVSKLFTSVADIGTIDRLGG
jgi:hypothetical protein